MLICIACSACGNEFQRTRKQVNQAIKRQGFWRCMGCAKGHNRLNIIGQRFGRLLAVSDAGVKKQKSRANFLCDCGAVFEATSSLVIDGRVSSCGCRAAENRRPTNKTHGMSETRTYRIWMAMRARCKYESSYQFHRYGGRGIKVCAEWLSFEAFLRDMGCAPDGHSIDRIDNDGDYEPGNCRWADHKTQCRNKSDNRRIVYDGKDLCLVEWAELLGIDQASLSERIEKWGIDRALTTPKGR